MRTLINVTGAFALIGCLVGALVNWFALRKGLTLGQSAWEGLDGSEASQRRLTAMRNFAICLVIGACYGHSAGYSQPVGCGLTRA